MNLLFVSVWYMIKQIFRSLSVEVLDIYRATNHLHFANTVYKSKKHFSFYNYILNKVYLPKLVKNRIKKLACVFHYLWLFEMF